MTRAGNDTAGNGERAPADSVQLVLAARATGEPLRAVAADSIGARIVRQAWLMTAVDMADGVARASVSMNREGR